MLDIPEDTITERRLMGRALAKLRADAGLTQPEAAERLGVTLQAWQNYEYGRRKFSPDLVRKVSKALDRTAEDLLTIRSRESAAEVGAGPPTPPLKLARSPYDLLLAGKPRMTAQGLEVHAITEEATFSVAHLFGADVRVLPVADDKMIPYAAPGGYVTYSLRESPKIGEGCVIHMSTGELLVRQFEGTRGASLQVSEIHPAKKAATFELTKVLGIYKVGLRAS